MRFIFNPSTGNLETTDNVTSPLKPLGDKFKLAELDNFNTPDLEQSPDSFLKPGETLEEWDETFRRPNAHGGLQRQPFAPMNVDRLAGNIKIKGSGGFSKGSFFHGLYSDLELIKDMKAGKYLKEIAQSIYNKNPAYFDSWKKVKTGVKKAGQKGIYRLDPVFQIIEGMKQRLRDSNPKLLKFVESREEQLLKTVAKDVVKFVKDNKVKYTNPHNLYNEVIDFIDKKYPNFIQTSDIKDLNLKNQKIIPNEVRLPDAKPRGGTSSAYRDLQRLVHKALGINYEIIRSLEGGNLTKSTWLKSIEHLLPIAQEQGLLPKTFKSPLTGKMIKLTPNSYRSTYMNSKLTDPLFEIFGGKVKWSTEHPGGIGRAVIKGFEDPATLKHGLPMQSFKEYLEPILGTKWQGKSPNTIKGLHLDSAIKRNLELASRAIDDVKRSSYIKAANTLSAKAHKTFGTQQTMYGWKDGKFTRKYPKLTLEDNLLAKTKAAIHNFISNKNLDLRKIPKDMLKILPLELKKAIKNNKKILGTLPKKLQESIKLIESGKSADSILKSHLDDVIPDWNNTKNFRLNNFAGAIDLDVVPSGVRTAIGKSVSALGKTLKVLGPASFALDVVPFVQARDLGIDKWGKVGAKNLVQEYLNLPRTIEDLFHVAGEGTWKDFGSKKEEDRLFDYKPRTFGTKSTVKSLRETSTEDLIKNIKAQGESAAKNTGVAYGQQVLDPLVSEEEIKKRIKKALEQKAWADSLPLNHPLVKEKIKETVDIKETDNVFGTQIPMKSISEGFSRDQFMAEGGRVGFDDGSKPDKKMSEEEILESIRSGVFELEQNWNTEKSIPGKILDVADVSNWPYYAARMLRAGMSVAEISLKLPFVSIELLGKLATQPAFKVVKTKPDEISKVSEAEIGLKEKFSEGLGESWLTDAPQEKLEGQGLFTEAFHKLMPGTFADKTGLTSLIESQEQAMQDKGMSKWPEIAGKNIEMGLDITLPFGYVAAAQKFKSLKKLLTSVSKNKNVNKVIEKALTDKGMSRREFNTLIATGGIVATLKALGIDNLFKGMKLAKDIKTVPIKMLKNTSTKMPLWFPKFIEQINKKMIYEGKGMWNFKGTDDFLPGFHIERINDNYYITGKNDYGQEFQVTYESPGWVDTGAPTGKGVWNDGEFRVDDAEPIHVDPDGNVDFDGVTVDEIDDVLGGTTAMENVATKTTRKNLTKGEEKVIDADTKYQSEVDVARDEGLLDDLE